MGKESKENKNNLEMDGMGLVKVQTIDSLCATTLPSTTANKTSGEQMIDENVEVSEASLINEGGQITETQGIVEPDVVPEDTTDEEADELFGSGGRHKKHMMGGDE